MAIELNKKGLEYAKQLIAEGKIDFDSAWAESQPSAAQEDEFITNYGLDAYELWFLGVNTEKTPDTKGYFEFPFGDFNQIFRHAVIAAKQRAGQYHHAEIEAAADELLDLIDAQQ